MSWKLSQPNIIGILSPTKCTLSSFLLSNLYHRYEKTNKLQKLAGYIRSKIESLNQGGSNLPYKFTDCYSLCECPVSRLIVNWSREVRITRTSWSFVFPSRLKKPPLQNIIAHQQKQNRRIIENVFKAYLVRPAAEKRSW